MIGREGTNSDGGVQVAVPVTWKITDKNTKKNTEKYWVHPLFGQKNWLPKRRKNGITDTSGSPESLSVHHAFAHQPWACSYEQEADGYAVDPGQI